MSKREPTLREFLGGDLRPLVGHEHLLAEASAMLRDGLAGAVAAIKRAKSDSERDSRGRRKAALGRTIPGKDQWARIADEHPDMNSSKVAARIDEEGFAENASHSTIRQWVAKYRKAAAATTCAPARGTAA